MMSPLIARMGVNVGRWGYPATPSLRMPDCRGGVFAVFAKIPPPSTDTTINAAWMVFVATWRAASRLKRTAANRAYRIAISAPQHAYPARAPRIFPTFAPG